MTYDTEELEKLSLEAIEKNNLVTVSEVFAYLPIQSRATFYNHGLDKLDTIKEALTNNKINIKVDLRKKWYDSDNATLQLALMKLVSEDEDRRKLSQSYHDHTTDGESINKDAVDVSKLSTDELLEYKKLNAKLRGSQ